MGVIIVGNGTSGADAAAAAASAASAATSAASASTAAIGAVGESVGVVSDGVVNDETSIAAAYALLPSHGGAIIVPNVAAAAQINSRVNLAKPVVLDLRGSGLSAHGALAAAVLRASANLRIQGQSQADSEITAAAGQPGLDFTGPWNLSGSGSTTDGRPVVHVADVRFTGGSRGIDTSPLNSYELAGTGFSEGNFKVQSVLFDHQTDVGLYMNESLQYGYVDECQFNLCESSLFIGPNTETKLSRNIHKRIGTSATPTATLKGTHHVVIDGDQFEDSAPCTQPSILMYPSLDGANGVADIVGIKAAAERKAWMHHDFHDIEVGNRSTPLFTAWQYRYHRNHLYGPNLHYLGSVSVTSNVATIVIDDLQSYGHGLQVNDSVKIVQCHATAGTPDCTEFNGTQVITAVGSVQLGDSGTGTAALQVITDGTKSYTVNQWAGYRLFTIDGNSHVVVSNTATTITVDGAPPVSGAYRICARQSISFAHTRANLASTPLNGGVLFAASVTSIALNGPVAAMQFVANNFVDYCVGVDDTAIFTAHPRFGGPKATWHGNAGLGPTGLGFREFVRAGKAFSHFEPQPGSPLRVREVRPGGNDRTELRNRFKNSEDLTDGTSWGQLGVTPTAGQTDPLGGTNAFKLTRAGSSDIVTGSIGAWAQGELMSATIDVTSLPTDRDGYHGIWAKAGTAKELTVFMIDGGAGGKPTTLVFWHTLCLTSDWRYYPFDFSWNEAADMGAVNYCLCPGGIDKMIGDCYVFQPQLSDVPGPYLPTSGAMASDTKAGSRFQRDVLAHRIRSFGAGPTVVANGSFPGLGTGGTATRHAGVDAEFVVSLNTGTGSPGTFGEVDVTFATPFPGAPNITLSLEDGATANWLGASTVRVLSKTANGFTLIWTYDPSATFSLAASKTDGWRITCRCSYASATGL